MFHPFLASVLFDHIILILSDMMKVKHGESMASRTQREPGPLTGRPAAIGPATQRESGRMRLENLQRVLLWWSGSSGCACLELRFEGSGPVATGMEEGILHVSP